MRVRLPLDAYGVDLDDPETWPECDICDSKDHVPRFATHRAYPVDGPIDYCASCTEGIQAVYAALGAHLHVEELQLSAATRKLRGSIDAKPSV